MNYNKDSMPKTEALLSQSTDIYVVLPITANIAGVTLTIPLTAAIGTIDRLERRNTRTNTRRYGLGKHAFEPLDIIPGPVTTTLLISKIVLYKDYYGFPMANQLESLGVKLDQISQITKALETNGEFQGLFGITNGNVLYQQKPIHIQVINYDNSGIENWDKSGKKVSSITYYWNCWITDNPIAYNLQNAGNVLVKQDVSVDVGRVETYDPNLSRVITSSVSSLLPTSITF